MVVHVGCLVTAGRLRAGVGRLRHVLRHHVRRRQVQGVDHIDDGVIPNLHLPHAAH